MPEKPRLSKDIQDFLDRFDKIIAPYKDEIREELWRYSYEFRENCSPPVYTPRPYDPDLQRLLVEFMEEQRLKIPTRFDRVLVEESDGQV